MGRGRDRDHARRVAGGGAQEGGPGHVDELDGLVDARSGGAPTSGANGLTLTTTMSMSPMPCSTSCSQLLRPVAAREDAGVDLRVEGPDLAPDERRDGRSARRPRRPRCRRRRDARACRPWRRARTPSAWRSRANADSPSRFATESSARTGAVPPPAVRQAWRPAAAGFREGSRSRSIGRARRRAEYTVASVAYSDGPSAWPGRTGRFGDETRAALALGIPVRVVRRRELPRSLHARSWSRRWPC